MTITSDMLVNEYKNLNITTYSSLVVQNNPNDYYVDPYLKKYVLKRNKLQNEIRFKNIEINISKFKIIRSTHKFLETQQYHYYNENIEDSFPFDDENKYYYNIEDKGNYSKYAKSSEVDSDTGFRVSYIINESVLKDKSSYITFNINRLYHSQTIKNRKIQTFNKFVNIKIRPEEILNIDNSNYRLSSIILYHQNHYLAIIRLGEKYYFYDDNYSDPYTNYTTLIGSYTDINNFMYKGISNFALETVLIYSMKKYKNTINYIYYFYTLFLIYSLIIFLPNRPLSNTFLYIYGFVM